MLRALVAFVGILFLVSIFLPFLGDTFLSFIPEVVSQSSYYWSFTGILQEVSMGRPEPLTTFIGWFSYYWTSMGYIGFNSSFLIIMLAAQILTVLFAGLAALTTRRFLILLATISSVIAIVCMWLFSQAKTIVVIHLTGFELGFWLALVSAVLFGAVFAISLLWHEPRPA